MTSPELIGAVDHAVELYEKLIGEYASRTKQMLDRYGYVDALQRIVISPDLQNGFRVLRDQGKLDLTFEAVIVRFASEFTQSAVEAAQWRLDNANKLL